MDPEERRRHERGELLVKEREGEVGGDNREKGSVDDSTLTA
jgi:hypothetical protein